jgi:hypothetical protein
MSGQIGSLEPAAWQHRSLLEKSREHCWSYFGEIF